MEKEHNRTADISDQYITVPFSGIRSFFSRIIRSTPFLLATAFILYFSQISAPLIFSKYFGNYDPKKIPVFMFIDAYTLVWFFLIPILINKFIFNESLREMHLTLPTKKLKTFFLIILTLLVVVPYILLCTQQTQFKGYSLGPQNFLGYTFIAAFLFPLYYLGEEFFFRGFLFLGLWKRVGWHSFWITDLFFTLAHLGKPGLEVLFCIPITVIFNSLTLYTRSIYPAVIIHSCAGVILCALVTIRG